MTTRTGSICQGHPVQNTAGLAGFGMVEMTIVVLLIATIAGFALLNSASITPRMQASTALGQAVAQLRTGREAAVTQRRNIEIRFLGNNEIRLVRINVPAGSTLLSSVTLEGGIEFRLFDGVPDTPDRFGNAGAIDFGGWNPLTFLSDGTLVNAQGNPVNGTVFLGLVDNPKTARAVTVIGSTGRIRGYRWTGTTWIQ